MFQRFLRHSRYIAQINDSIFDSEIESVANVVLAVEHRERCYPQAVEIEGNERSEGVPVESGDCSVLLVHATKKTCGPTFRETHATVPKCLGPNKTNKTQVS